MGEPVGDQSVLHDALRQFIVEADRYGYQLVFYEVGQSTTMLLTNLALTFLKPVRTVWLNWLTSRLPVSVSVHSAP